MSKVKPPKQVVVALDPVAFKKMSEDEQAELESQQGIEKSEKNGTLELILKGLKSYNDNQAQRLSFEADPANERVGFGGLYKTKTQLIPDTILKRICGPGGDDLVNAILQARSAIIGAFGRPRVNRFQVGYEIEPIPGIDLPKEGEEFQKLQDRITRAKKILWNCGHDGLDEDQPMTFAQFLKMSTRNGVGFGRFATEFIYKSNVEGGRDWHSFRPTDPTTIHRVLPKEEQNQQVRERAIKILEEMKNKKLNLDSYKKDEYQWVQVINGSPIQAFTKNEMVVHNLYPVTDVEFNGYPLTPIDQAINAVTTHINITMHNKLYFQHGRAARGMLIFQSDDIDEATIQRVRLQFHQSINSVNNSWRMPVFGVGQEDKLTWQSIDVSGRDAEFQFLSDSNARVILSAFQMSPEELPGYAHLSRGTNTQALSESDNEYKLTAARDVGLRPLIYEVQDFVNTFILIRIDSELAKTHQVVLTGLDRNSPEKEATQLANDSNIHMTYDEIMEQVEKPKLGKDRGGAVPLNPTFQNTVLNPYFTVGEIMENFMGRKGAASDPRFNFYRDQFWMSYQQLLMQKTQMQMQNMMMQQQQAAQANGEGGDPEQQGDQQQQGGEQQDTQKSEPALMNFMALSKATDANSKKITNMLLDKHRKITESNLKQWNEDAKKALKNIKNIVDDSDKE